jgi:hypothetical protein
MIKRLLATIAVAGLALAVPAAAFAGTEYPAPEPTLTCDTAQVALSATFACTVTGEDGATVQLQTTFDGEDAPVAIAGTVISDETTIASGEANFVVTAPGSEGTIDIVAFVDGEELSATAAVEVVDELSGTGFDGMPLAIGAGALLAAGAAVIFIAAARRNRENARN